MKPGTGKTKASAGSGKPMVKVGKQPTGPTPKMSKPKFGANAPYSKGGK